MELAEKFKFGKVFICVQLVSKPVKVKISKMKSKTYDFLPALLIFPPCVYSDALLSGLTHSRMHGWM